MNLKLMYITNDPEVAKVAEVAGVDWVFIDLEINGKEERQGHLDTVISRHSIDDVEKVRRALTQSKLLVRINPIYEESEEEINKVINDGADIVMLPFFKTAGEVETFIDIVAGRAKTCLLLETPEAVECLEGILSIEGIDFIHIGLNDLHLGYGMDFMFELLSNGTVERLCEKFRDKKIAYGFGGIARLGEGELPAELIIAEHYRLGSEMAILSRSFCNLNKINDRSQIKDLFQSGVSEIRDYEKALGDKEGPFFDENSVMIKEKVANIVERIASKRKK
ncbi:aldolase/citrate lyase family protein [Eubacteriaceae bacterium ES3]|nr:aldolase/citrate lyase family protein [Eubacteriaceae bacterium ES3]